MSPKGYFASGKVDASIPADYLQFHHRLPLLSERSLEHCSSAPHIHVREAGAEKVESFTGVLSPRFAGGIKNCLPSKVLPAVHLDGNDFAFQTRVQLSRDGPINCFCACS